MAQNHPQERIKVPRFREEDGFYTSPERSKIMGKIRGRDTKPELAFRKALWHAGYRYRIDYRKLIGKPDIALKKHRTVIFIDGEFWHGKNWEERQHNIKSNIQRDQEVNRGLRELGYTVFRFWEGEVKKELDRCLEQVLDHLGKSRSAGS